MEESDKHFQFNRRPSSTLFLTPAKRSVPQRKKPPGATDSRSEEKILEFDDFSYVVKDSDGRQSTKNGFPADNGKDDFSANLDKDHLSKALKKERIGLDKSSLKNIVSSDLSKENLKCIYFTSVYIINNYFGSQSSKMEDPQKVLSYASSLLPSLSSKIKYECFKIAKAVKAPDYVLNVRIVEAVDLTPSDADGQSDPYCKIWMNNEKEKTKKTSVKKYTLSPKWNESFKFRLKDLKNDVLHIVIWDEDPRGFAANFRQIKNVKGLSGFRLFCRDCCRACCCCCCTTHSDDFVGKVDVSVNGISSEGIDSWIPLKDMKGRKISGKLHISAEFKALRPKHTLDALKRHLLLFKVCLQQCLNENKDSHVTIFGWEQLLSPSAFTLMFQHSIQSSLTSYEDALCRFIVFVYLVKNQFSVNYQFLYRITDETYECVQQLLSTDHGFENSLEDLYKEAVGSVYELCKTVVVTLHSIDFVDDESKCVEFEFVLRCITICNDMLGTKESLWTILKSEAVTWFNQLAQEISFTRSDEKTKFFVKTLTFILSCHSAVDELIENIFPDKSYTHVIYQVLDSVLSENLKPHIVSLAEESLKSRGKTKETKMLEALELFFKIKELGDYINKITEVPVTELKLGNFREWFGSNAVEDWFKWKQEVIVPQVKKIISNDNLENKFTACAERLEKQSSSVTLTANLIQKELIQLWNFVFHPNCPTYDLTFLEVLHFVCMKYSEFLLGLIHSRNILSNFQSGGKNKLCVMANNLWSLAIFVQKTVSETVINIPSDSYNTGFCLKLICCLICADISREFERNIVGHIKNVVDAKKKKKQTQALKVYIERIQYLLWEEAMPHMAFEVYLLFMREIWKIIIEAVKFYKEAYRDFDTITAYRRCTRLLFNTASVSSGLLALLTQTEKLCFIDDRGRLKQFIWTDDYKVLKRELQQLATIS